MSHNPPVSLIRLLTVDTVRAGSIAVIITDLTKAVVFSTALPTTNYQVFIQTQTNVSVVAFPSALTKTGFTLNLSIGVVATFSYLAVGNL